MSLTTAISSKSPVISDHFLTTKGPPTWELYASPSSWVALYALKLVFYPFSFSYPNKLVLYPICVGPTSLSVVIIQSLSCVQLVATHGLKSSRLLCPWDFSGKNFGVGCHYLLQEIFPTQGLNLHFLHWQVDSLLLSHQGSPLCPLGESYPGWEMNPCERDTYKWSIFSPLLPLPYKNPQFAPQNFISKSLIIMPLWNSLLNTCIGVYTGIFNVCNKSINAINTIIRPILQMKKLRL